MSKYEHKNYGGGFTLVVTPPDRADDVMHYLLTGQLFCNRSLEGVEWEVVDSRLFIEKTKGNDDKSI